MSSIRAPPKIAAILNKETLNVCITPKVSVRAQLNSERKYATKIAP